MTTSDEQKVKKTPNPAKRVLVFSTTLRLVAVCSSVRDTAALLQNNSETNKVSPMAVNITLKKNEALMEMLYTCKGYIVRYESPMVELDIPDIGVISLGEYMHLAQERRGRIPIGVQTRKINLFRWRALIEKKSDPREEAKAKKKAQKAYRKKRAKELKSRPDIAEMQIKRKGGRKPHRCCTIVEDNYKTTNKYNDEG